MFTSMQICCTHALCVVFRVSPSFHWHFRPQARLALVPHGSLRLQQRHRGLFVMPGHSAPYHSANKNGVGVQFQPLFTFLTSFHNFEHSLRVSAVLLNQQSAQRIVGDVHTSDVVAWKQSFASASTQAITDLHTPAPPPSKEGNADNPALVKCRFPAAKIPDSGHRTLFRSSSGGAAFRNGGISAVERRPANDDGPRVQEDQTGPAQHRLPMRLQKCTGETEGEFRPMPAAGGGTSAIKSNSPYPPHV